jgi:hypothetical protein
MNRKTPLILLGILVLLAGYIYVFEIKGKVKKEKAEAKAKKLLVFEIQDIRKLSILRASDSFSCEKNKEEDWRLLSPVNDRGDKSTLSSLVTSLTDLKAEREDRDVQSFADFGLDPAQFTVIAGSADGKSDTLYLGQKNPSGSFLYARKPREKRLVLTSAGVESFLTKPLFDLRDKSVLPFEKENVERIRIDARGKTIVIAKTGGAWNLTEPIKAQADESGVDSFLNQFKWAQAKEYIEENPKSLDRYGLSKPAMSLTLTLGADKSQNVLSIGNPKGKDRYYAKDAGRYPVFLVDTSLAREFRKTVFDFRDKKIVRLEIDSVKSVAVEYPDGAPLACRRDTADTWFLESPQKAKAVAYKISGILYDMRDMLARDFLGERTSDLAAFGLVRPAAKIRLKDRLGRELLELWVGGKAGDKLVFVMNAKSRSVFKVDDAFVKNLRPKIDELVEKTEAPPPKAAPAVKTTKKDKK